MMVTENEDLPSDRNGAMSEAHSIPIRQAGTDRLGASREPAIYEQLSGLKNLKVLVTELADFLEAK